MVARITADMTTSNPPMPTDRVSEAGVRSSDANPINTVSPLMTTARPAVVMERTAASWGPNPRFISSLKRVTMSRE